jgi:hypothetical protein
VGFVLDPCEVRDSRPCAIAKNFVMKRHTTDTVVAKQVPAAVTAILAVGSYHSTLANGIAMMETNPMLYTARKISLLSLYSEIGIL